MKKSSLVAACALVCGTAFGQSDVTVYGTVDAALQNVRSGPHSTTKMVDGANAASRVGFRGHEDLGGGMRAGFVLEMGVDAPSGQGTLPGPVAAFSRQSYVHLSGDWGRLEMGRMYTPMFFMLSKSDPFGMNAVYSPLNSAAMTDAQPGLRAYAARSSNMLRYLTPSTRPVVASLAYAHGPSTASTVRRSQLLGGSLGWTQGSLFLGYALHRVREGAEQVPTAALGISTHHVVSAAYQWSNFKLSGNYIRNSGSLDGTPSAQLFTLGGAYNLTPFATVMAQVVHRKVQGSARGQDVIGVGSDYALSKRTMLYGRYLYLANRSNASATLGGVPVVANSGHDVRSLAFGVRHSF